MMIPVDAFGAHNWDMSKNVRRGTNRTANEGFMTGGGR